MKKDISAYLEDASTAKYTAVISDLHLTEAEPEHPKFPLWKKFKSSEFFFDEEFKSWLNWLESEARGEKVELILNGDIFDFDSVMAQPENPPYRVSFLEKLRGLYPQESKSVFKIQKILEDHPVWVSALREFLEKGNSAVIITGNHDLELHFAGVKREILKTLDLSEGAGRRIRFCEWFYISNKDTLIEHSNQHDPYCVCQNPINPFIRKYNQLEVRISFGNLAGRFLINGMPFLNPHSDKNFIMSLGEYVRFFFKYLLKAQPLIIWSWFWGSIITLVWSFVDAIRPEVKDPLTVEERIETIASKSNATPRMVRELRETNVHSGSANPIGIARELWLDRAFIVLLAFIAIFQLFAYIKLVYSISFFWAFIPLFLFLPFFIFYAKSIKPDATNYKEPRENILLLSGQIARVQRIVYGHTHVPRHELIGDIEHLNSGTWSPAFFDVECTKPAYKKTFVWIFPGESGEREALLMEFENDVARRLTPRARLSLG